MAKQDDDIRGQIQRIKTLPTLPGVVKKLCTMVESEETSAAAVGDIISTDQVLTAKVLKIVNSSFYGFPGRIGTINHALVLLGFNVIKGIVLTAAVIDYMSDSLVGLWEHSLGVATAADVLARHAGLPEPEEICTAGLLHDLGKVILCVEMREMSERVVSEVQLTQVPIMEAEKKVLDGLTHCDIVGWLGEEWNLPPRLREPMTLHHNPSKAEFAPEPTAIIHIADVVTRALQFGSGGDPYVPKLETCALQALDMSMADLASLLDEIDDEFDGIDTTDFA